MSYNTAIPQSSTPRSQSQRQIKANFQAIQQVFANNHVPLTADSDFRGMHKVLTMRSTTDPSTTADQIALYNKLVGGVPNLFFRPNSDQTPIQLTYDSIDTDPANDRQYTFMAGPFVIYAGVVKNVADGQTITLTPAKNLIYVGLTPVNSKFLQVFFSLKVIVTDITANTFTVSHNSPVVLGGEDLYYLAIGV